MSEIPKTNDKHITITYIGVLWLISSLIMYRQLLTQGYFSCLIEDTYTYTSWASQFAESLREGIIYPRWTPLNFWGYGSPTFILYPPLAFYLTSFFNVLAGSVITAMNITKYTALLLSGIGMFFLVREFYSEKSALLSAIFYIGFPFNVFGLYYYGTFASVVSLMWFSPIILFTYKYIDKRQYKYVLYAGLCYGGLIFTHLINAYMFTFVMSSFVLSLSIIKKRPWDILAIPVIILTGSLVSAAYLFPLLFEKHFFNINAFVAAGGGFDFAQYFIYPNMTGIMPPGNFWPVYYKEFETEIFLLSVFICIFMMRMARLKNIKTGRDTNSVNFIFIGTALGSLFLLFGLSSFIWNAIPFFKFIQFPFRWLNITFFAVAFLSAAGFRLTEYNSGRRTERRVAIGIVVLIFLVCILYDYKYIVTSPVFTPDELIPPKSVNWTKEHLPAGVDLNKISMDETKEDRITFLKGEGNVEITTWNTAKRSVKIELKEDSVIRIRTFYFPGWKAFIDGKQTGINREDGTGAILVGIPRGEHLLELKFVDSPISFYSKIVTIVTLLVVALSILTMRLRYRGNQINEI